MRIAERPFDVLRIARAAFSGMGIMHAFSHGGIESIGKACGTVATAITWTTIPFSNPNARSRLRASPTPVTEIRSRADGGDSTTTFAEQSRPT